MTIYVPATGPVDWKRLLADPELHWKEGRSAQLLAGAWHSSVGFPADLATILRTAFGPDLELLLGIPEFKVPLPGGSRPSQTDLFVLARTTGDLVAITVEAKAGEPFGPLVRDRMEGSSDGLKKRLDFLLSELSLRQSQVEDVRYQLLHRTVSAMLTARRFHARHAVLLVHSFSEDPAGWDDFQRFVSHLGISPTPGQLQPSPRAGNTSLWIGWVTSYTSPDQDSTADLRSKVRMGASALWRRSQEAAERAATLGRTAAEQAANRVRDLTQDLYDRLIPECEIPTFLLPTGPSESDFVCHFDFTSTVTALRQGKLVRPRIVAWSGRPDVDRLRLATMLRDQFASQFREQKLRVAQDADPVTQLQLSRIKALERDRDTAGSRMETAFKVTATAVGGLLLVANPVVDLLFLTLALFGGSNVLTGLFQQIRSGADLRTAEAALEGQRHQLERDLDLTNVRFREAVGIIEVRVHGSLQELVESICELEGWPFLRGRSEPDGPEVRPVFADPQYLARLAQEYHVFLPPQVEQ